ncbi:hypothetical protein M9H77_35887 [Catharanthus roseus]|uniref:Uncharacterized protein n=1 Tax=Catharanthus roseus TaxID=4058 RepID=A0ACB9ZQ93_CATRO|nr:hypothetical protein M9H77_35887 [Catharanthus roseus]
MLVFIAEPIKTFIGKMELIRTLEWSINHTNEAKNLPFEMDFLRLGSVFTMALAGDRCAADLLSYTKNSNIRVTVHTIVERVLLDTLLPYSPSKPLVIGVVYCDQRGRFHPTMLRDKGEVLLCAGALGSPQLLFLSGIRLSDYLSSWRIPVERHHPYVGKFVYDNFINVISIVL